MSSFESLKVSTKTIIAFTNLQFRIPVIFDHLSPTEYFREVQTFYPHKPPPPDPFSSFSLPTGFPKDRYYAHKFEHFFRILQSDSSCIRLLVLYYQDKKKVSSNYEWSSQKKSFRNALNVIYQLPCQRNINFKLSKNGKFQITGCKDEVHAMICIHHFLNLLYRHCPHSVFLSKDSPHEEGEEGKPSPNITILFHTVMTNLDFSLGYHINRQALDELVNQHPVFRSLLETSFGYTGVNVKFPLDPQWYKTVHFPTLEWNAHNPSKVTFGQSVLSDYGTGMERFLQKPKYNTFLVFHSGNIIMSGMIESSMKNDFYRFLDFLRQHRREIEEHIML